LEYKNQLNHIWKYEWANNNLTKCTDPRGDGYYVEYQYDPNGKGNIIQKTTTVDAEPANNIVEHYTYDANNQLIESIDGGGTKTSHRYNNTGQLLSTQNPDLKESEGQKFDQYGNVVEINPSVSGVYNIIKNGSMEIQGTGGQLLANWERQTGGSASATLEGFNSHGNSALKLYKSSSTTDLFKQYVPTSGWSYNDVITIRADLKLVNASGVIIKIDYGCQKWDDDNPTSYDAWFFSNTGTATIPFTGAVRIKNFNPYNVKMYIGFNNGSGTVWFDGVQLTSSMAHHGISAGFNSVENGDFEDCLNNWSYTGSTPAVTSDAVWGGLKSAKIINSTGSTSYMFQDVPVYSGEPLTFSGMAKTDNVTGTGVYYKIDYYNQSNQLIQGATVQTGYLIGTQDFARLSCLATAPTGAKYAHLQAILDGTGTAYFDTIKLIPRKTTESSYNTAGNYVLVSKDALARQSHFTYDENVGNKLSSQNPLNYTTGYNYDSLNRLVDVTLPIGHGYNQYDSVNNLIAIRDPRSSNSTDNTYRTQYQFNNINQLSAEIDPLNRTTSYTYDGSRNLTNISMPTGGQISFTYDTANRLTTKTSNGYFNYSYTYDVANNITQIMNGGLGTCYLGYDRANRVVSTVDARNYDITYNWDKSNNLNIETLDANSELNRLNIIYNYGDSNKLNNICLPPNEGYISHQWIEYDYDEDGQVFHVLYYDDAGYDRYWRNITYNTDGRCSIISDNSYPSNIPYTYAYDNNGNITRIDSWAGYEEFTYDGNNRVTSWSYHPNVNDPDIPHDVVNESYTYDAAGNLTQKGSTQYTYNAASQVTNAIFTYDNNGNMTNDGIHKYAYDSLNRLTAVKSQSGGTIESYTYYYNGLRRSKTSGSNTTYYHWDQKGDLVRESTSADNTLALYYYSPDGKLVGMRKQNDDDYWTNYIVHDNLRGDIISLTVTDGTFGGPICARFHYDTWGNKLTDNETFLNPVAIPFGYAGYYYDGDSTGLYYIKNRYYSPRLGRFLTRDSSENVDIEDPKTFNLYSYAENNPVSNVDPDGNFAQAAATVLIGASFGPAGLVVGGVVAVILTVGVAIEGIQLLEAHRKGARKSTHNKLDSSAKTQVIY
jgi:RHS repeat-associated protein